MANGTIGDDPVSDILDHGRVVYGDEVDGLVRELAELLPRYRLWDALEWPTPPAPADFSARLRDIVARLREQARAAGWEVTDDSGAR